MTAAPIPWRPLGRLLVARGLLSEEQLEAALDEQSLSGRRLGETLIHLGFISHSTLSLALAEQYGIHPSVESGFGTGLRALLRQPSEAADVDPAATLVAAPEEERDLTTVSHLEQKLEEQWAQLAAAQEQLADAAQRLKTLERLHERRRAQTLRLLARIRSRRVHRTAAGGGAGAGHLVFVQSAEGYELLEREGPPPPREARLELDGFPDSVFVVTTLGRSPLPHDRRLCAFAQPLVIT